MSVRIAVVIPNFNGERILPACLDAVAAQSSPADDVLVVDNGSSDGSLDVLRTRHPNVRVLALDRNHGFAGGVNRGVRATDTPWVAVLNSDARPRSDWLAELRAAPVADRHWCLGSVLVGTDGLVESAADQWSDDGYAYKLLRGREQAALPPEPFEAFAAPGAAPLIRRAVFDELDGYCERFFLYYEDVDIAYRALLRGHRALIVPAARVEHDLGGSGTRPRTRFYVARNSLWCAVRCIPEPRARRLAWRVLWELRVKRRPLRLAAVELAGRIMAILGLPWALRERRRIQRARRLEPDAVRSLLAPPAHLS